MKLYGKPVSKAFTPRTVSFEKLQLSLYCSKFNMVPRKDCMGKLSGEPTRSRVVQTARDGCRPVRMQFNQNNKAELVYPISDSSQLLFPS